MKATAGTRVGALPNCTVQKHGERPHAHKMIRKVGVRKFVFEMLCKKTPNLATPSAPTPFASVRFRCRERLGQGREGTAGEGDGAGAGRHRLGHGRDGAAGEGDDSGAGQSHECTTVLLLLVVVFLPLRDSRQC